MTDIAFAITQKVWTELPLDSGGRGDCFFCIGGLNAINPFSATAVKNEIIVYADSVPLDAQHILPEEGAFFDIKGSKILDFDFSQYGEIYMDFNGSMAFFGEEWMERLRDAAVKKKVCCNHCRKRLNMIIGTVFLVERDNLLSLIKC